MKASNSIDIFVNSVCDNIKYSPLKSEIKNELYEHILEEKENYIRDGMDVKEAEKTAINNMGDPKQISKEFNKIYKNRLDWKMLIILLFFMIINVLLVVSVSNNINNDIPYIVRNIIYIIIGTILFTIMYFTDYSQIQKYSWRNWYSRNLLLNSSYNFIQ